MAHSYLSVVSPPAPVYFAGWRSDTQTLGRNKWEVAVHEEPMEGRLSIMLVHTPTGFIATGETTNYNFMSRLDRNKYPEFVIKRIDQKLIYYVEEHTEVFVGFDWVDTQSEMVQMQNIDAFNTPLFKRRGIALPQTESIIVDPPTILEMLEEIRKRQSPDQAKIRERLRNAEGMQQTHAQIISFQEAA